MVRCGAFLVAKVGGAFVAYIYVHVSQTIDIHTYTLGNSRKSFMRVDECLHITALNSVLNTSITVHSGLKDGIFFLWINGCVILIPGEQSKIDLELDLLGNTPLNIYYSHQSLISKVNLSSII